MTSSICKIKTSLLLLKSNKSYPVNRKYYFPFSITAKSFHIFWQLFNPLYRHFNSSTNVYLAQISRLTESQKINILWKLKKVLWIYACPLRKSQYLQFCVNIKQMWLLKFWKILKNIEYFEYLAQISHWIAHWIPKNKYILKNKKYSGYMHAL